MSSPVAPIIANLPMFGGPGGNTPDFLAAASPQVQSLLSGTGGQLGNLNSLAAANPQLGALFSLMSPGGGINPQQAQAFGPMFSLLMALQGAGSQSPMSNPIPGQAPGPGGL